MNQADSISTQEIVASVNDPVHLLIIFSIMIFAGILGGGAAYFIEINNSSEVDKHKIKPSFYILIGICASLLVPLFMTTISSDLLENSRQNHLDYFVFAGFCLIASISAHRFITSISEKILQEMDSARDEIVATKDQLKRELTEKDKRTIIEKEIDFLSKSLQDNKLFELTKEKAFSILNSALELDYNEQEKSQIIRQIITFYYTANKYEIINDIVEKFEGKMILDALSWAYVAVANMSLYNTTKSSTYRDQSERAADEAIKMQFAYGEPYSIKLYLNLIDYSTESTDSKQAESVKRMKEIFEQLLNKSSETIENAYQYLEKGETQKEVNDYHRYNELLRELLPKEFQQLQQISQKYREERASSL